MKFTCFCQPSVCCMFRLACQVFLCLILLQHFLFLFLVFEGLGSCQSAFFCQLFFGRLQASHDTPLTFCPFHKYFRCESFLPPVTSQSTKVYFPNSQVFLSIAQSSKLKKKKQQRFFYGQKVHTQCDSACCWIILWSYIQLFTITQKSSSKVRLVHPCANFITPNILFPFSSL